MHKKYVKENMMAEGIGFMRAVASNGFKPSFFQVNFSYT